jgi:hypothetical protein
MAEQQAEHRQQLETASLTADATAREHQQSTEDGRIRGIIINERIGQMLGFLVAAGCLTAATWGLIHDASVGKLTLFLGLPIAGVIRAFLPKTQSPKPLKGK